MLRLFLIFIVCLGEFIFSQQKEISYQTIEDKELSDIESKISKDLFFAVK